MIKEHEKEKIYCRKCNCVSWKSIYRKINPNVCNPCWQALSNTPTTVYRAAKKYAERKGIKYEISQDRFFELKKEKCQVCRDNDMYGLSTKHKWETTINEDTLLLVCRNCLYTLRSKICRDEKCTSELCKIEKMRNNYINS